MRRLRIESRRQIGGIKARGWNWPKESDPMVKSRKRGIGAYAAIVFLLWIPLLASCDSKSAEKYIREAEAERAAGKITAAIIDAKNALQKEPKNLEARVLLARFYLDLPDP